MICNVLFIYLYYAQGSENSWSSRRGHVSPSKNHECQFECCCHPDWREGEFASYVLAQSN